MAVVQIVFSFGPEDTGTVESLVDEFNQQNPAIRVKYKPRTCQWEEAPMRRPLSSEQRRRVEELVQEKGETCGLCGNVVLRCDEDAAPYLGGGYSVRLRCTNPTDDEEHAGGFGLAWDYSLTPEEAQRVGLS